MCEKDSVLQRQQHAPVPVTDIVVWLSVRANGLQKAWTASAIP